MDVPSVRTIGLDANEIKAKDDFYREMAEKNDNFLVKSQNRRSDLYLIEKEDDQQVMTRLNYRLQPIYKQNFEPAMLPASNEKEKWGVKALSFNEVEKIKENNMISHGRKEALDEHIAAAYEPNQDTSKADIASYMVSTVQKIERQQNSPLIYSDMNGVMIYEDMTGKILTDHGLTINLNQEETTYLANGLQEKWESFKESLSEEDYKRIYQAVEENYDFHVRYPIQNEVMEEAVNKYGKDLTSKDLERIDRFNKDIAEEYGLGVDGDIKKERDIASAYTFTTVHLDPKEYGTSGYAVVPFKHRELEELAKKNNRDLELALKGHLAEKLGERTKELEKDLEQENPSENEYEKILREDKMTTLGKFTEIKESLEKSPSELALSKDPEDRIKAATEGKDEDLDVLVHDGEWEVRKAVAQQGRDKDLDKLVNDIHHSVRVSVAEQGRDQDLDQLVSDKHYEVRRRVAEQGRDKDLDILVNDKAAYVRMFVARQGREKDLAQLASDKEPLVRRSVAETSHDTKILGKLANDPEEKVSELASGKLIEQQDLALKRQEMARRSQSQER